MANICMSYNLILYRANYFVLREHFVFNVLCRTCRHLCAGFSEGVVLTSEFDLFDFVLILHTHGLCATASDMASFVRTCMLFDITLILHVHECVLLSLSNMTVFVRFCMLFDFVIIWHTHDWCATVSDMTSFVRTCMLFDFDIFLRTLELCATLSNMTVLVRTCLLFDFLFCTRMSCVPLSLPCVCPTTNFVRTISVFHCLVTV